MKKYFKYFLYGIIYIVLVLFFAIMFIVTTRADVIKPNNGIEPYQVVKIQLRSLKNNDDPFKNAGIEQTWEFAHPNNKKFTGPLEKFKNLICKYVKCNLGFKKSKIVFGFRSPI